MPCNATSQLTNAPSVPLQVTMPTNNAQWAVFVQRLQAAINATRDAANRQPVNVVPADFAVYNGSTLPALSIIGATSALDTTKHQFGAASLKLTATASTVTVEFSANPILLQPNARWIESVYIQSSRPSIAGTLAIDTPAGSYPVDISGTLLPGTWGRLYGDCDLTADFSTTATMVLTLTGCSVGDTFNLEGWQIEAGTGNLPSPFVNTTVPQTYVDTADNAAEALTNANAAQSSATAANAQLADIASDNILSPAEKPTVIRDYAVITAEQAGIDGQAVAYGITTQKAAYDAAISALTAYLATLTTPTAWNDKSGNTTIVGTTFRSNFNTVYTTRQTLLNAIYAAAQGLANAAQGTANTANTTANTGLTNANTALSQIGNLANSQYLQNPFFSTGDLTGWSTDHGTFVFESGTNGPASGSTSYATRAGSSANPDEALRNSGKIPVYPGAVIKAQCAVKGYNSPNGACGVRISWRDAGDLEIGTTPGNTTTGNATNGTYVTGSTNDARVMFAHVECAVAGHTTGNYSVDNFAAWALADTLDQVPDSGTRFAAATANADNTANAVQPSTWLTDSANMARAGDSITRFGGRTLDNVGDSASRFAAVEASADATSRHATTGENLCVNGGFESNTVGSTNGAAQTVVGAQMSDGWTLTAIGGGAQALWYSGAAYAGSYGLLLRATQGSVVPANSGYSQSVFVESAPFNVTPGDTLSCYAMVATGIGNAGIGIVARVGIDFVGSSGGRYGIADIAASTGWVSSGGSIVVPQGTTCARAWLALYYANGTSSPITISNDSTFAQFDDVVVTRNDVRVAGSGQTVGDQRNLNTVTWAGVRPVIATANPVAYTISGTTVNFTVTAFTLSGGGFNVGYSASSGSVTQAAGTTATWYLYYRDPTGSGGSKTLNMTIYPQDLTAFADIVRIGSATVTVASGGGGSGGTGSGGGGGSGDPPGYPIK